MKSGERRFRHLVLITAAAVALFLLFIFSSLNLKSIDYGYMIQELIERQAALKEDIDRLRAQRSELLNLERIERIATCQLGYGYPQPGQVISVCLEGEHDH